MSKSIPFLLALSLLFGSPSAFAENDLDQYKEESENIWRTGTGAQDGAYSAIAVSMLGWGLGLAAVIAIVASVLHQSTAASAHTNAHVCH